MLDGHRAGGGGQARDHAQRGQQQRRDNRRPETDLETGGRIVRIHPDDGLQQTQQLHGKHDAERARHQGQRNALEDDLREDIARRGADGAADADLRRALLDGDHHDVAHADHAREDGAQAHQPDQEVHPPEEIVHQGEHLLGIDDNQGLLVLGVEEVLPGEDFPHPGLLFGHPDAGFGSRADEVHVGAPVVDLLGQGQGDEHRLVRPAADADVAAAEVHAHDLVEDRTHLDEFSARVTPVREQFVVDAFADHAGLALLQDVGLVDIAAVLDAGLVTVSNSGIICLSRSTSM